MSTVDTGNEERRKLAVERLKKRSEFRVHLAAYVLVNALIVTIWFMVGGGFFWPVFPLLGWGIGLFFHGMDAYQRPLTETQIQREMERLP